MRFFYKNRPFAAVQINSLTFNKDMVCKSKDKVHFAKKDVFPILVDITFQGNYLVLP